MEEKKDISQIALQRIKESGIKPISKNVFNLKRVLFWSLVGFSVVIGAISFSITLSILFNNEWYLYNKLGFGFILKTLPYFWVVCLLLFTLLAEFYYRKTFLGYRHRVTTIIAMYIVLTVISGSILHIIGVGEMVEQALFENVPVYHVVIFDRNEIWSHPESGLLSGKIISVNNNIIQIIDSNGVIWGINIDNTFIEKEDKIKVGEIVKIVGYKDNDNDAGFTADEIHLWMGCKLNCNN